MQCSKTAQHDNGKIWFGVWKKDQPPRDYPVHPLDYVPPSARPSSQNDVKRRLRCVSLNCGKISLVTCPRQFCAHDCRLAPGGPCTTHVIKPTKLARTAGTSRATISGLHLAS